MPTQQLLSFFAEIGPRPKRVRTSVSDGLPVDVGFNPSASTAGAACWVITMPSPMSSTWIATNAHTFHVFHHGVKRTRSRDLTAERSPLRHSWL